MLGIDGKVVSVTGASGGMGGATTMLLAERGGSSGGRRADRLDAG
jgi:NADP-dependent 3-hydroxy acid dehydrogenase YdfG